MSFIVHGSSDSIVDAVNVPDRIRRAPPAISQFCDSQAEKSRNFRC